MGLSPTPGREDLDQENLAAAEDVIGQAQGHCRCSRQFFALGLGQGEAQQAMGPAPVGDGHTPPAESNLRIRAAGESQGFAHLVGAHAAGGVVAPLDDEGVVNNSTRCPHIIGLKSPLINS